MDDLTPQQLKALISPCKRIFVWGNGGSGKSTLAELLAKNLGIPYFSLDDVQWEPGWKFQPEVDITAALQSEVLKPSWIIEFADSKRIPLVTDAADIIIWLDPPLGGCLFRIIKRSFMRRFVIKTRLGPEPVMGVIKLLQWVMRYRKDRQPHAEKVFAGHSNVYRITHWKEIKRLIQLYR